MGIADGTEEMKNRKEGRQREGWNKDKKEGKNEDRNKRRQKKK